MPLLKQIGILIAILSVSSIAGTILVSFGLSGYFLLTEKNYHFELSELWQMPTFFALFTVPIGCLIGVPAFFMLKYCHLLNLWTICILGASIGSLIQMYFARGVPWVLCIAFGASSALIAWVLMSRSNLPLNSDAPKSGAPVS